MLLLGCLAGCSTTPQNSQEQGNPVIKEEISQPLGGSEALGNSEDSSALSAADKEKMFAPYEQYGMTYDAVKDELCLTIDEAAEYFNIGEKKLRKIVADYIDSGFVIQNGVKVLIKRKRFEDFLEDITAL